jgi:hypothetical protein
MMDPLEVEVAVSSETARRVRVNDLVGIFATGIDERMPGRVISKSATADPRTLTFDLRVVIRNRRSGPTESGDSRIVVERVMGVQPADPRDENAALLIPEPAIVETGDGSFVWALTPIGADRSARAPSYRASRVAVKPAAERRKYQEKVVLRPLSEPADLAPYQLLAVDEKETIREGDTVRTARTTWALRPGDVVRVSLASGPEPPGVFAPIRAIRRRGSDLGVVFLADEGVASAVEVRLGEIRGSRQRIASTGDAALAGGSLIVQGTAYLEDGDPVRVLADSGRPSDATANAAGADR